MKKFASFVRSAFVRCRAYALAAFAMLGLCSVAKAEGNAGNIDISIVSDIGTKIETALTSFWTDNKGTLIACIGIIVALALVWLVVKVFKRGTSKA